MKGEGNYASKYSTGVCSKLKEKRHQEWCPLSEAFSRSIVMCTKCNYFIDYIYIV
jgi:hypothetical protein